MLSPKFNEYCISIILEKIDDYFDDGSFIWENNGAKEFVFIKNKDVFIHNVGNVGNTHALALGTLIKASKGLIEPNEDGYFIGISAIGEEYLYEIKGNYKGLSFDESDLIMGRYWDKRDPRINSQKPFGFWMFGGDFGEEGVDEFIINNGRDIKLIIELLSILPREYYFQFNYLSGDNEKYFRSFRNIRNLINKGK
jgi:hypothetical protein